MKRSSKLQLSILKKLEASDAPSMRFEEYSRDYGGYEDASTPDWTNDEAYNIHLMIRDGLVRVEKVTDAPWLCGGAPDDPYAETYVFLTTGGHDEIERSRMFKKIMSNIRTNWPTVTVGLFISILTTILAGWANFYWGAPQ